SAPVASWRVDFVRSGAPELRDRQARTRRRSPRWSGSSRKSAPVSWRPQRSDLVTNPRRLSLHLGADVVRPPGRLVTRTVAQQQESSHEVRFVAELATAFGLLWVRQLPVTPALKLAVPRPRGFDAAF